MIRRPRERGPWTLRRGRAAVWVGGATSSRPRLVIQCPRCVVRVALVSSPSGCSAAADRRSESTARLARPTGSTPSRTRIRPGPTPRASNSSLRARPRCRTSRRSSPVAARAFGTPTSPPHAAARRPAMRTRRSAAAKRRAWAARAAHGPSRRLEGARAPAWTGADPSRQRQHALDHRLERLGHLGEGCSGGTPRSTVDLVRRSSENLFARRPRGRAHAWHRGSSRARSAW